MSKKKNNTFFLLLLKLLKVAPHGHFLFTNSLRSQENKVASFPSLNVCLPAGRLLRKEGSTFSLSGKNDIQHFAQNGSWRFWSGRIYYLYFCPEPESLRLIISEQILSKKRGTIVPIFSSATRKFITQNWARQHKGNPRRTKHT